MKVFLARAHLRPVQISPAFYNSRYSVKTDGLGGRVLRVCRAGI